MDLIQQIKESEIEIKKVNDLMPYVNNCRKHELWQVAQVAASIKEFGFTNPVLIDSDGEIIAGHARVMAALKLELAEIPCIVLDHLTDLQKRAYVIADNKLALNSSWDFELLETEIDYLKTENYDVDVLGFSDFDDFTFQPPNNQDDDAEKTSVHVFCDNSEQAEVLFGELSGRGLVVKLK